MNKIYLLLFTTILFISCNLFGQTYTIYGLSSQGGTTYSTGDLFKYDISTKKCTELLTFNSTTGQNPYCIGLYQFTNSLLYGTISEGGKYSDGLFFSYNINTGKDTILFNFNGSNGQVPEGNVIQASDGYLYGTPDAGGTGGNGVIFRYDPVNKKDTVLYSFGGGVNPHGDLIQASNGLLYGITTGGGTTGNGVIYSYNTKTFKETVLYNFTTATGTNPWGSLIQASDSLLYGLTQFGGAYNYGVLFSYSIKTGIESVLVNLDSLDGMTPQGSLIQANNGLLYGMTGGGGSKNKGAIFSYNIATGKDSVIHNFIGTDGATPLGTLVQSPGDSLLYGVTSKGGTNNLGVLFSINPKTNVYIVLVNFLKEAYPDFGKLCLVKDTGLTEINQLTPKEQVHVFPNPSSDIVHLIFPKSNKYFISINDISGKTVRTAVCETSKYDLSIINLIPGIYFIKFNDGNGKYISTYKLIVQ